MLESENIATDNRSSEIPLDFKFGVPVEIGQISKYDAARQAVAECRSFDEVREWEDKAAAVREYSRRARDRGLELDAWEIRERARRRRGEMLRELRASGALCKKTVSGPGPFPITLESLEITKNESARDQKIAALDPKSFEERLARRAHAGEHPEKHAFDVLRAPDEPINGSRAIMAGRTEPDDSIDLFPTPPFATRALVEIVLRDHLGVSLRSAWEPACGEGHTCEPLREYCPNGFATDLLGSRVPGSTYRFCHDRSRALHDSRSIRLDNNEPAVR